MNTVLVWVLLSYSNSNSGLVQLGNYATLDDCKRVLNSEPVKYAWVKQCVQVNMVVTK